MSNASRVRIICDPFKKEIEYQWYDFSLEDYVDFDPESSRLASDELVNATIQNRAHEIVGVIQEECNVGSVGLEIVFIGTQSDYEDLCRVIDTYYGTCNITCLKDTHYYNTASDVMLEIKDRFAKVKGALEEYPEDEIKKMVYKYNDAVKPSISLCVMGLYSAGKSAFINSIIGAEILPSGTDPTTAKVCKIFCAKEYRIKFGFDGKECVLIFEGKNYKPNSNCDKEIIKELQSIVELDGQHDEIYHMNAALWIINNYNDEHHSISDMIEISVPFRKSSLPVTKFEFVIYDTPGSNSKNNEKHFEVLRDSLDEQTNALPIFLTTRGTLDAEDNDKILNLIEDTGTALDATNAIIVVNRADEEGPNALKNAKEKLGGLSITKWKSTRIFFVSSLIGIASKKDNPDDPDQWLDEDMWEKYKEKKSKYENDERKLYEYNIIDESKIDEIEKYDNDELAAHFYKNCGLESVEREIVEYAEQDALYNKCQQGLTYLQGAIDKCVESVQKVEERLDSALKEAKEHFDKKKGELCDNLEEKKKDITGYNTEFQKLMEKSFSSYIESNHLVEDVETQRPLREKLQESWKKYKEEEKRDKTKKENGWALSQIQNHVENMYNDFLEGFSKEANAKIAPFWDANSKQFKDGCIKIVRDSDALTDEQKEILKSIVLSKNNMNMYKMELNLRKIGAIRHKKVFFWKLKSEKFDVQPCMNNLVSKFQKTVRDRVVSVEADNERSFKKWGDDLVATLIEELCKFNSDLDTFEKQIAKLNEEINSKKECEAMLEENKQYIDSLLEIQGGEENE